MTNDEVAINCEKAKTRYDDMTSREAKLSFSYELQGFAAAMVGKGVSLKEINSSVIELMVLLIQAQKQHAQ